MTALGMLYDKDFFDSSCRQELIITAIKPVVESLIDLYKPSSVIDFGCGDGLYLGEFIRRGIKVQGYDNSREALRRAKIKRLPIKKYNIVKDALIISQKADLAICFEVAEHLPESCSKKLVKTLTTCSDSIVFTAAPPGQGGTNHINEKPCSFWIKIFNLSKYYLDKSDTEVLKKKWTELGVVNYMITNLMVFKRMK